MADVILQAEVIQDSGDFKHLTACETPEGRGLLVCVVGGIVPPPTPGQGPIAFAEWAGSGTLVGDANGSFGYAADVPNGLATDPIQKPRSSGNLNVTLSIFVTFNDFVASTTRFEIYRNGAATGNFIDVPAGVIGPPTLTASFALGIAAGERFDLRVSNPGGGAEVGKQISFGWSADFF